MWCTYCSSGVSCGRRQEDHRRIHPHQCWDGEDEGRGGGKRGRERKKEREMGRMGEYHFNCQFKVVSTNPNLILYPVTIALYLGLGVSRLTVDTHLG